VVSLFLFIFEKKLFMKRFLSLLIGMVLSLTSFGEDTLIVGVKESAPFAYQHSNGHWDGIAIDLVDKYLEESGRPYKIVEYKHQTYNAMVDSVASGHIDLFAGDMTITNNRLEKVNFSQPYYVTNTSIATLKKEKQTSMLGFFNLKFLRNLLSLLVFVFVCGFIIWVIEHKHNDGFNKGPLGIFDGSYFISTTMTTVGYGDISPKTKAGKIFAFIVMWLSLGMVGFFYGNITASLTVAELESKIENVGQLNKLKVGTIGGTASSSFLDDNDVRYISFETPEEGLDAMVAGELDAFVYDKPIIQYYMSKDKYSKVTISDNEFMEQTYGFAIKKGSNIEDGLNKSILSTIRGEEWKGIMDKYNVD
jgi:ABC-type amino acid transport substrate-binding protein